MSRRALDDPSEDVRLTHETEVLLQVEPPPGLDVRIRHRVRQTPPRTAWVMLRAQVPWMAAGAAALLMFAALYRDGAVVERALTPTQQGQQSPHAGTPERLPVAGGNVPGPLPSDGVSYRTPRVNAHAAAVGVRVGAIPERETDALHAYLRSLSVESDVLFESAAGGPEETAAGLTSAAIAIAPLDIELLADVVPLSGEGE